MEWILDAAPVVFWGLAGILGLFALFGLLGFLGPRRDLDEGDPHDDGL